MENLVEEFFEDGWPSYGLIELARMEEEGHEGDERLDRLTRILSKGNKPHLEKAQNMLYMWLRRKDSSTHPWSARLRLRRVFILKRLRQFDSAINEVKQLLALQPDSATLTCLQGVLYGWLGGVDNWKLALTHFDKAVDLESEWWEPRFEGMEKMLFLGLENPEYWKRVVDDAKNWEGRFATMTDRERLIVLTYGAVAATLLDPSYIDTPLYAKQDKDARETKIPKDQQEDWYVQKVYTIAVKGRYPGEDEQSKRVRSELRRLLGETHSKLVLDEAWLDD